MRTLVALVVGALALPIAAAARPPAHFGLTATLSAPRAVYGHALVLSGRLDGSDNAGRKVTVAAWPYGVATPTHLATVRTDARGGWRLAVRPRIQTTYEARAAGAASVRLTAGVAPAVSLRIFAHRLRVDVQAATPMAHRLVQLQAQNANGSWTTIARRHLTGASTATFAAPSRPTLLRVAMSVNQAGVGYLGATSSQFVLPKAPVALAASAQTVLYGHRVTLTGRVASGRAGEQVAILAHPYGRPAFTMATVTSGSGGQFRYLANPTILTLYQARLSRSASSLAAAVDVRPTIVVRQLANGQVRAHVMSAAFLYGRSVQLQLRAQDAWRTVAKRRLDSTSSVNFAYRLAPHATFRVAMSVNQAGPGYLGSASHAVVYRGV